MRLIDKIAEWFICHGYVANAETAALHRLSVEIQETRKEVMRLKTKLIVSEVKRSIGI
jgi:hypothetical protein